MNARDRHPNAPGADDPAPRLPPQAIEAEQSLIGALLIGGEAFDQVADVIVEGDFYRDDHRRIFRHVGALVAAGKPVDVVTVAESIAAANETDQTGGLGYLAELAAAVASTRNARRYAEIVADRALLRALVAAGDQAAALGWQAGSDTAAERVDAALGLLMALQESRPTASEPAPVMEGIGDVLREIDAAAANGGALPGLSTGFIELDAKTTGLHPGEFIVLAGRPAMGKTALAINIAERVALDGGVAAVFSMEMTKAELARRTLASVGRIPLTRLRTGQLTDGDWEQLNAAVERLAGARLIVDETGGLTLPQLRARARRIKRQERRLDLLVVDYLQLMEAGRQGENRNAEMTAISRGMKALAKELRCPIIGLSQLSRKVEERGDKRPVMSDLRESGAIEQDADIVLMMFREEYYDPASSNAGIAEVIIGKQRNGPTGQVLLAFHGEHSRFANLAHGQQYAPRSKARRGKGFDE